MKVTVCPLAWVKRYQIHPGVIYKWGQMYEDVLLQYVYGAIKVRTDRVELIA